MPTNFRLAYNSDGFNYTDLFPKTSIGAIVDADNIYEIVRIQVDIPAPGDSTLVQIISAPISEKMAKSPLRVYLLSTGRQAELDYGTINQLEARENELLVTRLYNMPVDTITVELVFFEQRGAI